jgi:hypothetical protein
MALAWIEEIHNNSSYELLIRQTDPSKNPFIDSVEGGGWHDTLTGDFHSNPGKPTYHDWFMVAPGTLLKTSLFVIPWANTNGWVQVIVNREKKDPLTIEPKKSGLRFQVAPEGGGKQDYVRFYDWNLKAVSGVNGPAQIGIGAAGGANSTSGRLVVTDDYLDYQITTSNSAGDDTLSAFGVIGATLLAVAGVAATAAAA